MRIHRATLGPWWFSSDGSGRFDPTGGHQGACHLAEQPLGAWIEVFREQMLLAEEEVHARSLLSVALGRDLRLADLTSRRALAIGVTASVMTPRRTPTGVIACEVARQWTALALTSRRMLMRFAL